MITIYHNPRCGKSRCALAELAGRKELRIREYLKEAPDVEELRRLAEMLGLKPLQFIRTGEEIFKARYAGKNLSDNEWLQAIADNPVLLQRPIVVKGEKAWIVRDNEALEIIRKLK